jgi:hypothetical protein
MWLRIPMKEIKKHVHMFLLLPWMGNPQVYSVWFFWSCGWITRVTERSRDISPVRPNTDYVQMQMLVGIGVVLEENSCSPRLCSRFSSGSLPLIAALDQGFYRNYSNGEKVTLTAGIWGVICCTG